MTRHEGHQVSASTALRITRARNLPQPSRYTHETASTGGGEGGVPNCTGRAQPGVAAGLLRSSRPPTVAPGDWPAARRTGQSTSSAGTSNRPRISMTPSRRSSWRPPRPRPWPGRPAGGGHRQGHRRVPPGRDRHRQRWPVDLRPVRPVHRLPPRPGPRPDQGPQARPQRCARTRLRLPDLRAALPRRHRRYLAGRARRPTASSSTPSPRTKHCPGTAHASSASAAPARAPPTLPAPKPCHHLDTSLR